MTDATELAALRELITDLETKLAALDECFGAELASIAKATEGMTIRQRAFQSMICGMFDKMTAQARGEQSN
jgi:hypothetical protein